MAIFKRGSVWWYEFQFQGIRIRESARTENAQQARSAESNRKNELVTAKNVQSASLKSPRFTDFVNGQFRAWCFNEHRQKPQTFKRYMCSVAPLISFFGNKSLVAINSGDVELYKLERSNTRRQNAVDCRLVTPATVNRDLATLRIILNFALRLKHIRENPVVSVRFLREPKNCLRVVSRDEEARYLAEAPQWLADLVTVMLDTGMRPSEILNLTTADLEPENRFVHIRKGKTTNAIRFIPLTRRALEILERRTRQAKSALLFCSSRTRAPIQGVRKAHLQTMARARISPPFRIYDLRHTSLTRMAMAGVDLPTLKELAGHSQIQMTMRYVHPTPNHKRRAIMLLEQSG